MTVAVVEDVDRDVAWRAGRGRFLAAAGLAAVVWWTWTWWRVHDLLADHVSAWGPLPVSASERSALYAYGTPAERRLSSDLSGMAGLYPWGQLPLHLGGVAAVIGFVMAARRDRAVAVIGACSSVLVVVVASMYLGDTVTVALDILE